MCCIGVLSLQGSVKEHLYSLNQIKGLDVYEINDEKGLMQIDGLIIPGGESTTIGKLIKDFGLFNPLVDKIKNGMPVWGTCAGMILLAKKIVGENYSHLAVMDISVTRNAYGSQLNSFIRHVNIPEISQRQIPLVFIRAPRIENVGVDVEVLAVIDGNAVAARQGNILVTAFHPELTTDISFHNYFVSIVKNSMN